jgi:hypothetical protein
MLIDPSTDKSSPSAARSKAISCWSALAHSFIFQYFRYLDFNFVLGHFEMFKSETTELDCASFLPAHHFFTNEKPPDEKSRRRRRIPARVQFVDQSFITSVKRKVILRFTDSIQKTTAQAKLVSQSMSIYIAVHERDFDMDESCLWKEGKEGF